MTDSDIIISDEPTTQALSAVRNTGGKLASLPDPKELKTQLNRAAEYRDLIREYILAQFSKDVHYYRYHFKKDCKVYKCKLKEHLSPTWAITGDGAKKMAQDFLLFPDYKPDHETRTMLGDPDGLICLICFLYTLEGKFFASGRGSSQVGAYSDANRTIKMAEKNSLIDALKSSGMLADFEKIICEKEGEVYIESNSEQSQGYPGSVNTSGKCPHCFSTGKFHARTCVNFNAPIEGEVV